MDTRPDNTWIQTYTGHQVWPLDPRPEDFVIEDIAHALSNICRYTGHCRKFYSVAQHSVHVAEIVPVHLRLTALLHDAAEAYIADMARPVKHSFPEYLEVEHRLEVALAIRYGLVFPFPKDIKDADNIMLNTERRNLMGPPPGPWNMYGVGYRDFQICPWTPEHAEKRFLEVYTAITSGESVI